MDSIPLLIQLFIRKHQENIDNNKWDTIYDDAYTYFKDDYYIGYLTDMLREVQIHPENYFLSKIPNAFAQGSKAIDEIVIPNNIVTISASSFYDSNLKKIDFSDAIKLKSIQSFAFCQAKIEEVILPPSIQKIGMKTFAENPYLKKVYIPESCACMAIDTFYQCPNLIINCHQDSYAHKFLSDLNYNLEII